MSRAGRPARRSLRRTLILVLVPGMMAALAAEIWLTWRTAQDATNAAYDRSLLGAIKAIDANISTASGGLGVELPYRMLEFFELTASGAVYFKVSTEDGLVEIGDTELPPPPRVPLPAAPMFNNTAVFDTPVRMGSYARALDRPIAGQNSPQRVVIQVAETLGSREQFTRALVLQALERDLVLVLVAGMLLLLAVAWALRPLARLRSDVLARSPGDLTPIAADAVPAEVLPLVEAINDHVARNRRLLEARRHFVDDASHQLRTPLATLATQLAVAQRTHDPGELREVLRAAKTQLDGMIRQTNQMLVLARADAAELADAEIDLVDFAGDVARRWWPEARQKSIDLGLDAPPQPVTVRANAGLLQEALANLLHNAIRYTPAAGRVTVSVTVSDAEAHLGVIDDGPGIPEAERLRAGERFFRASNASLPGSGLGLAIVRSIAERHGGRFELGGGPQGTGLAAWIVLPLADAAAT